MKNITSRLGIAFAALSLMTVTAGQTNAGLVIEIGDAGQTRATAQVTSVADGFVSRITGSLSNANDVDAYQLILTGGAFTAGTITSPPFGDPMLFLFDASGNRVLFNDDAIGNQSFISSSSLASGTYYLAISSFSNGYSQANLDSPFTSSGFSYGDYQIDVTGANSVLPAAVPEPSTIALACSAVPMGLGLAWKRRRKAA